ncbi:uncharacterized protein LOC119179190 isoform X6 [Rhipicephalus microplus]|uniref:uncharacterized protein LOC119179190 isoform X6 n=1 Tax=Rhipicephalus microplus TaxID=6941 RepID=UPI003F6C1DFD
MRLCLFHALFTFIFMLALSASKEMALESSFCTVNSSTTHNCVNTTWIPKECTVWNGPGTFCVNRTLNPTLCRDRVSLEFIESPINDSDASFAELTDPSYPGNTPSDTSYYVLYDNEFDFILSADTDWCEGTEFDVSSDMELHAADRIDRVKETATVFYLGEE